MILGEIINGKYIGKINGQRYIWQACIDCSGERWVACNRNGIPKHNRCNSCRAKYARAENHSRWKGGAVAREGRVFIRLQPEDYFYPMADSLGYARKSRLVLAQHLGQLLDESEDAHHKNGITNDDRIENLELMNHRDHARQHRYETLKQSTLKKYGGEK